MDGSLSFNVDLDDGYVTVAGSGMWTAERAEQHFRNLQYAVLKLRREHRRVLVLVDLRAAAVQTPETAAIIHAWTGRIYRSVDRVAVVCATALLALQIKRASDIETLATFHELAAAEAWIGSRVTMDAGNAVPVS